MTIFFATAFSVILITSLILLSLVDKNKSNIRSIVAISISALAICTLFPLCYIQISKYISHGTFMISVFLTVLIVFILSTIIFNGQIILNNGTKENILCKNPNTNDDIFGDYIDQKDEVKGTLGFCSEDAVFEKENVAPLLFTDNEFSDELESQGMQGKNILGKSVDSKLITDTIGEDSVDKIENLYENEQKSTQIGHKSVLDEEIPICEDDCMFDDNSNKEISKNTVEQEIDTSLESPDLQEESIVEVDERAEDDGDFIEKLIGAHFNDEVVQPQDSDSIDERVDVSGDCSQYTTQIFEKQVYDVDDIDMVELDEQDKDFEILPESTSKNQEPEIGTEIFVETQITIDTERFDEDITKEGIAQLVDSYDTENQNDGSEFTIDEIIDKAYELREKGDFEGSVQYYMKILETASSMDVALWAMVDICVLYKKLGKEDLAKMLLEEYYSAFGNIMDESIKMEIEKHLNS